jgi:YwiC-like protein
VTIAAGTELAGRPAASSGAPLPAEDAPRRTAIRPLALPTEHGGWGILLEPIAIGLIIAPSWGGALIALAASGAFLARHPLKLAMQDVTRKRRTPRTAVCLRLAAVYGTAAIGALLAAFAVAGWRALVPFAVAVPGGLLQLVYDIRNRSRALLPEMAGPAAIGSTAAAIALAGGFTVANALAVWLLLIARSVPSVLYVRSLLRRSRGVPAGAGIPIAAHLAALAVAATLARLAVIPWLAAAAIAGLLVRAVIGLNRPVPPAKRIGWREVGFGTAFVAAVAIGYVV